MNSVYTAGRYSRRDEIKSLVPQLKNLGIAVTSRWLDETAPLNVQLKDVQKTDHEVIAMTDVEDIDAAQGFVFFAEDQNNQPPRGGRHVEFGYALARGKAMHVIGERENIFHYLPGVNIHPTWAAFVDHILQNQTHEAGRAYLAYIAWRYRKQYSLTPADLDFIHKWIYEPKPEHLVKLVQIFPHSEPDPLGITDSDIAQFDPDDLSKVGGLFQ